MISKKLLYEFCLTYAENRISRIQNNIKGVQESLASETKSSAGDKHETGRAMLQLEREKLGSQLAEAEKTKQILNRLPLQPKMVKVGLGSLVNTTKARYFIAISAGEYIEGNRSIFCISAQTPIAKLLLGKSEGDIVVFNGEEIKIIDIA